MHLCTLILTLETILLTILQLTSALPIEDNTDSMQPCDQRSETRCYGPSELVSPKRHDLTHRSRRHCSLVCSNSATGCTGTLRIAAILAARKLPGLPPTCLGAEAVEVSEDVVEADAVERTKSNAVGTAVMDDANVNSADIPYSNQSDADDTLDSRSDAPCYVKDEERCNGNDEIQVCMWVNGGLYWRHGAYCQALTVCVHYVGAGAYCETFRPFVDCWPSCPAEEIQTERSAAKARLEAAHVGKGGVDGVPDK